MNRLMGICVLATTAISIITHRRELAEAWRELSDKARAEREPKVVQVQLDGKLLREVMDITRP